MKSIRGATLKLVTTFAHGPNAMKWGWFSDRVHNFLRGWLFGDSTRSNRQNLADGVTPSVPFFSGKSDSNSTKLCSNQHHAEFMVESHDGIQIVSALLFPNNVRTLS